jgi:hypothetical protein
LEFTLLSSLELPQLAPSGPNPPVENNNSPYLVSQPEQHEVGIEFPIIASSAPSQSIMPTAAPILTYQHRRSLHPVTSQIESTSLQPSAPDAIVSQLVSSDPSPVSNPPATSTSLSPAPQSLPAPPSPPKRTHLQHGIVQPKIHMDGTIKYPIPRALLTVIETTEPTCYTQASKHAIWRAAMVDEINALLKNKT